VGWAVVDVADDDGQHLDGEVECRHGEGWGASGRMGGAR
jgi:hypothetical protein